MKNLLISIFLVFISTSAFAYSVDPTIRTHKNLDDVQWNVFDIVDDYVDFSSLPSERKQAMCDELKIYIGTFYANSTQ